MILLFLYWYINYAPFLFLEEDIKWIQRESRLLSAILEDAAEVKRLCTQIDTRAHQIWDSNLEEAVAGLDKNAQAEWVRKRVAVAGLDHNESKWVDKTISIVPEAQSLVESFEEMRGDSHRIRMCLGITKKNFMQIGELFIKSRRVKEEVDYIVKKKEHGINICESLERLRSNARRLQERPLDEHEEERSVNSGGRVASAAYLASSTVEKINSLNAQNPDLMQESSSTGEQIKSTSLLMQVLHPFLKDIQGLDRFESALEQAWVEEVVELIDEAHLAIENFLKKPSYRIRWLSLISSWKARRKIKGDIRCINFGFTQVLERKDRYGFKFTRRNSSKAIYQSPDQTTGDNIVSSVVGRMHNYLKEKSDVLGELFSEVALLFNQLESMRKLVGDAGVFRSGYNSRVAWLDQTEKIVHSVDEYVTLCRARKFETKAGIKLSREINQINHTISLFLRCIKAFSIELREDSSLVVGLEEEIDEVVSRLRTNNEHCSVTSVFGIEGIGKTTLAKKVYNHGVVVDHFPSRAWVSLSDEYSSNNKQLLLEDVAKQVLRSIKSETHPEINPNASSLIHKAHDILKEKRYLLVLDNISTKEEWGALKAAFPVSTSNGSRILVTTRHDNVASEADSDKSPLQLEPLTKEESWQLFSQVVHIPPKGKMLAKEILSKCGGIPLDIIRLLSGKDEATAQELKRVIQHCKQNDTSSLNDYTKKCITKLPPDLSNCLSCFKLFPRDYKIPVRRLFALWIAEGLAEVREHTAGTHKSDSKKRRKTYADSADERLSALIDRDIVQVVERKLNGKVRTCCLNEDLEEVVRSETMTSDQKRLADHVNCEDPSFEYIHGGSSGFPLCNTYLFSILSFDSREGYKPGEDIGIFLRRGIAGGFFLQLKFLDLERVFRPELPSTIGRLSKLRYLGLRWTCLESIPPSIGELVNLETLDLKHTYVHTLPSSIWKLHKLRHLYLSQRSRSKLPCHQGRSSLKNLRTLWGVFVDKHSPLKGGLDKISNLRKLGLAFHLENKEEQKLLAERIGKLNYLRSLRMRSIDEMGEPRPLVLESLLGLENLSSLNLFGVLESPSIIAGFPGNLTDLTLSASSFVVDPMPELEKLLNLQSLCFYSNSYTGKKMVCTTWGFQKLLILKLWKLEQLEDWVVQEKAMQNLRELEIRSCVKLKVPTGVRHLKTLIELKLTNMPEAFCAAMDKTKVEFWGDIAQCPEIITKSW